MKHRMKRYGITVAFVVFIIVSIGSFYIQASDDHYPEFILKKQLGNENEAMDVLLRGTYYNYHDHYSSDKSVSIGIDGSHYTFPRSFLYRMDAYTWSSEEVKQLVKDHRQFMRGKRADRSFYADDHLLVYADVESNFMRTTGARDFHFKVSVLDKQQEKSWSYKVNLPESKQYSGVYVHDVQVFGDEIIVITNNSKIDGDTEYHRYGLSLKDEDALKPVDQVIEIPRTEDKVAHTPDSDTKYRAYMVYQSNLIQPSRFSAVYMTETQADTHDDQTVSTEEVTKQVYPLNIINAEIMLYDMQTAQLFKVKSPEIINFLDNLLDATTMNIKLEGNELILTKVVNETVSVIHYNLLDSEVRLNKVAAAASVISTDVKDDRIYLLTMDNNDSTKQPLLYIADLNSGKTVYQGAIEIEGTKHNQTDPLKKLSINHIILQYDE